MVWRHVGGKRIPRERDGIAVRNWKGKGAGFFGLLMINFVIVGYLLLVCVACSCVWRETIPLPVLCPCWSMRSCTFAISALSFPRYDSRQLPICFCKACSQYATCLRRFEGGVALISKHQNTTVLQANSYPIDHIHPSALRLKSIPHHVCENCKPCHPSPTLSWTKRLPTAPTLCWNKKS